MGDWVVGNYGVGFFWVDLGIYVDVNGVDQLFGFFYNVNVKLLVWYNLENFEDVGYDILIIMEELCVLID